MTGPIAKVVQAAQAEAQRLGFPFIQREQLFLGLLHDATVSRIFSALGVDIESTKQEVEAKLLPGLGAPANAAEIGILPTAEQVLQQRAQTAAALTGDTERRPEHVLLGFLLEQHGTVLEVLTEQGVTREGVTEQIRTLTR